MTLPYEQKFIKHTGPEPDDGAYQLASQRPSSDFPYEHKFVDVDGVSIA